MKDKIYVELDEELLEIIDDIEKITLADYERKNTLIDIEGLLIIIRDLKTEYDNLQEEYENLQERYTDKYFGME